MIRVPLYRADGSEAEPIAFDEARLGGVVRYELLRQAVAVYEARRRVGSVRTRSRAEVAGSGRKLYRQKGTGLARAGSRLVPHRRGGGMAFALRNRVVTRDLPRKARRAALHSALLARLQDAEVAVVEMPALEAPRTRAVAEVLDRVLPDHPSCLLVIRPGQDIVYRSARNLARVEVCRVCDLNALVVLRPNRVLFTREAMDAFLEALP